MIVGNIILIVLTAVILRYVLEVKKVAHAQETDSRNSSNTSRQL